MKLPESPGPIGKIGFRQFYCFLTNNTCKVKIENKVEKYKE